MKMHRLPSRGASRWLMENKHFIEVMAHLSQISMKKLNCKFEPLDGRQLIATLKAEETLFSLLIQIQKYLMFLVNVLHKSRCFFKASRYSKHQILRPEWTYWVLNWRFVCRKPTPAPSINTFLHLCHYFVQASFVHLSCFLSTFATWFRFRKTCCVDYSLHKVPVYFMPKQSVVPYHVTPRTP